MRPVAERATEVPFTRHVAGLTVSVPVPFGATAVIEADWALHGCVVVLGGVVVVVVVDVVVVVVFLLGVAAATNALEVVFAETATPVPRRTPPTTTAATPNVLTRLTTELERRTVLSPISPF